MDSSENLKEFLILKLDDLDEVGLSKALTKILEIAGSKNRDIESISQETLLKKYLDDMLDRSENTIKNYRSVLLGFLRAVYPYIDKDSITSYLKKARVGWATNTKRRNYIIIKRFLFYLYRTGYLAEDLSESIEPPKKNFIDKFIPNDEEIASFFETLSKIYQDDRERTRYLSIFSIYAKTGLRFSELIGLDYKDVDFTHSRIYLNKTKNGDKTYVSMDTELKNIIFEYILKFEIRDDALIRGKSGKRINKNVISSNLRKIIRQAKLPDCFTMHAFRRYFIDKQRRSGVDPFLLKALARHKDMNTTMGYLKVAEEEKISAISNIIISA